MGYVDWRGSYIFELLFKLEKAILDLLLNVVRQLLLLADQFRVLRMATLLHNTTTWALECFVKLINAAVSHRDVLILLDLLGSLWSDTIDSGASRIHLSCHLRWSLVPYLWVAKVVTLSILLIIVDVLWFDTWLALLGKTTGVRGIASYLHLFEGGRLTLARVVEWHSHIAWRFWTWADLVG